MKLLQAKASIFLDKAHPKKNLECAISIRITYNRIRKYYPINESLTPPDFEKALSPKPGKKLDEVSHSINDKLIKAQNIIKGINFFTFDIFERKFLSSNTPNDSLKDIFKVTIDSLTNNDQIGTAVSYQCAINSFEAFRPGMKLIDITVPLLKAYEKSMIDSEKSTTTISMYTRHLRTIFNSAIEQGELSRELYPFGRRRYEIPQSNNIKKALSLVEIGMIYNFPTIAGSSIDRAKNYWIFMYLCNGLNMKDMARLKYENIKDQVIEFNRAKTARTKRNIENIRVTLTPDLQQIIKRYGNKKTAPENFIFPILTKGITAARERQLIQQITHVVNDNMRTIAKELKLKMPVTTFTCRHSFATILQRSGVSTEFISEALGHSNIKTTQLYLKGFEDKKKAEVAAFLTSFKNTENEQ